MHHFKSFIAALGLLAAAAITPAQAMSVTFTDVSYATFTYMPDPKFAISFSMPDQDPYFYFPAGSFSVDIHVLYGPWPDYYSYWQDSIGGGDTGAGYSISNGIQFEPYPPPHGAHYCHVPDEPCLISGSMLSEPAYYQAGLPITFYGWFVSSRQPIGTTTITFTGPDEATVVPIPAALPLLGAALAGLGFLGWMKRRMQ